RSGRRGAGDAWRGGAKRGANAARPFRHAARHIRPRGEPLQKPDMGRVSVAMASDARPQLPTEGAANSSSVSPSRATTQMRPLRRSPDGTGLAGRSAVSRRPPMGPTIGFALLRASHPGEPPSQPRGTYSEAP